MEKSTHRPIIQAAYKERSTEVSLAELAALVETAGGQPVATLLRDVDTVDASGNPTVLKAKGRHDPCVLPRAVPIVEAMAAMTVLDMYLLNKTTRL